MDSALFFIVKRLLLIAAKAAVRCSDGDRWCIIQQAISAVENVPRKKKPRERQTGSQSG